MKKDRLEKTFLEELSKAPIIAGACNKIGLSRQTIYRWMEFDLKFKKQVEEAIKNGTHSINDLAESKLIIKIKQEDFKAIKYWLDNHKKEYIRPRAKYFWDDFAPRDKEIKKIEVTFKKFGEEDDEYENNGEETTEE